MMSTVVLVVFNLLLNGIGSFAAGWLVARAADWAFRVQPGRAQVALAALPFAKIVFDLGRGVPSGSFLWKRAHGVFQDLGSFQIGFGVKWVFPIIHFELGALSSGHNYSQSWADLLATVLTKKVSSWAPLGVVALLASVAMLRLARRLVAVVRAWSDRAPRGEPVVERAVGLRRVRVFVSDDVGGAPFTAGIVAPYVCFPRELYDAFTPEEREAALLHELGHVASFDLVLVTLLGFVEDLFWFVPFLHRAGRRVRLTCELAADAWAVRSGATPETLASALVRCGETLVSSGARAPSTLALGSAPLSERVHRLLAPPRRSRWGFQTRFGAPVIVAWVATAASFVAFFGNH